MQAKKKRKNVYVELCRFLACCIIFSFHSQGGMFISGWIFVEYFFMLSGYFAAKHIIEHPERVKDGASFPIHYTVAKFKRLLPYTTISILMSFFITAWKYEIKEWAFMEWLLYLPENILLLPGTGVMPYGVFIQEGVATPHMMSEHLWYLCTMAVAMPIMLYLLWYFRTKIGMWLITYLPLLLYGWLIMKDGTIHGWHDLNMSFFSLNLRALAGLLLGASVYYISQWWKKRTYTKFGRLLLTVIEIGSCGIVAWIAASTYAAHDVFEVLLLAVSLSITLSEESFTSELQFKGFEYLGKISLPIYCLHCPMLELLNIWFAELPDLNRNILSFIVVFAVSAVLMIILELIQKLWEISKPKLQKLIVAG